MTDWLVLAGCFVIAVTAWLLDDRILHDWSPPTTVHPDGPGE
ncbi:hypothetical protein [Streptomyces hokutonensis]